MWVPDTYIYTWTNNAKRATLRGRRCRILVRGTKRSVLVEFADNRQRECVDFYALRRVPDQGALFYEPVTE